MEFIARARKSQSLGSHTLQPNEWEIDSIYIKSLYNKSMILIFHNFFVFCQVLMAFRDIQKEVSLNFDSLNFLAMSIFIAPIFSIPYCNVDSDQGFSFIS